MTNSNTYNTENFRKYVRRAVLEWLCIPGMVNRREPCGFWFTRDLRDYVTGYGGAELLPILAGEELRWSHASRRLKAAASKAVTDARFAMAEDGLLETEQPDRFRRWFVTEAGRRAGLEFQRSEFWGRGV